MSLISLSKTATPTYRLPSWSDLKSLFDEWWYRIRSRCQLESLSERDLADMGMTLDGCVQRDPETVLAEVTQIPGHLLKGEVSGRQRCGQSAKHEILPYPRRCWSTSTQRKTQWLISLPLVP